MSKIKLDPTVLKGKKRLQPNNQKEIDITYSFGVTELATNPFFSFFRVAKNSTLSVEEQKSARQAMKIWQDVLKENGIVVNFIENNTMAYNQTLGASNKGTIVNPLWFFKKGEFARFDPKTKEVIPLGNSGATSFMHFSAQDDSRNKIEIITASVMRVAEGLTKNQQIHLFLHELGHILGLTHGYKLETDDEEPHFPKEHHDVADSIMNYKNGLWLECINKARLKPSMTEEDVKYCSETTYPTKPQEVDIEAVVEIYRHLINSSSTKPIDGKCDPNTGICTSEHNGPPIPVVSSRIVPSTKLLANKPTVAIISPNWKDMLTCNIALLELLAQTVADKMTRRQERHPSVLPTMKPTSTIPSLSWLKQYSQEKQQAQDFQKQAEYKNLQSNVEALRQDYKKRFDTAVNRQQRANLLKEFSKKCDNAVNTFVRSQAKRNKATHYPDYLPKESQKTGRVL